MGKNNYEICLFSGTGTTRKMNQDNFYFNGRIHRDPYSDQIISKQLFTDGVFAVCDGMGGENDGEKASLIAVESLSELPSGHPAYEDVCTCIDLANQQVCHNINQTKKRSGTTIVLGALTEDSLDVYNIGDSKCFLCRGGTLMQLSKDHTLGAQMIDAGILTKEQARTDKRSHQLSQHIGIFPDDMTLSVFRNQSIPLQKDDILILCSDGLTDGLTDEEIANLAENNQQLENPAMLLANTAMQKGSKDNVTVIFIRKLTKSGGFSLFRRRK